MTSAFEKFIRRLGAGILSEHVVKGWMHGYGGAKDEEPIRSHRGGVVDEGLEEVLRSSWAGSPQIPSRSTAISWPFHRVGHVLVLAWMHRLQAGCGVVYRELAAQ